MGSSRLLFSLAARGLRYRYLKHTGRPAPPEALSLEITRRCIARCVMCNIWKTPPGLPELTDGEWLDLLSSPLLEELKELDITGGEPFLRDDLVELIGGICDLKDVHFRRLQSLAITTNGFLTQKILEDVGASLGLLEERGVGLVLALGMDAVGDLHDRIRNYKGGWVALRNTVDELTTLRKKHPGLVLGIKTTVTRYNVGQLDQIARFAETHGLFAIISPFILTPTRYDNLDRADALAFSSADLDELERFYESPRFQWSYYRDELRRFLEDGEMRKPCSAGFNYYFVRSTGDLYPCPIIETRLGNVKREALEELTRSPAARAFRKGVGTFPECRTCTEPGLERYALPFEGLHYLKLYFKLGRKRFSALHEHLGLGKYWA